MQQLQLPPLAEGEVYIGATGDKNSDFYNVVLLPGDHECDTKLCCKTARTSRR